MRINDKNEFNKENVFGLGSENTAFAQYFVGNSYLNPLTEGGNARYFWQMSLLSRGAATTGISTMPKAAADSFLSVPPARAGIRRRENLPSA